MTIQEGTPCEVAGQVSAGGICSHLISAETNRLTFQELIDFLEAQPARTCVSVPGMQVCAEDQSSGIPITMVARGAAIAMSAVDWGNMKTELEIACRELGKRCTYIKKLQSATSSTSPPH